MPVKNGKAVHVRLLTKDQLLEVQKAATDQGLSLSTYMRRESLLAARRHNDSRSRATEAINQAAREV